MIYITLAGEARDILLAGFNQRLREYDARRRDCLAHPERVEYYAKHRLGPSATPGFWVDKAEALQEEMASFGMAIR
jgi:hypothetical protein